MGSSWGPCLLGITMLFTQEEEAWGEPGLSKVTEASDKAAPCREAPE